jgi:hypothetical protein
MAKKKTSNEIFPFYDYLWHFYESHKKRIVVTYTPLTKKFLAYNDPSEGTSFLRLPQYQALEIYVFLKEYLNNKPLKDVFDKWRDGIEEFAGAEKNKAVDGQLTIYDTGADDYGDYYESMKAFAPGYTNYIFALTMGVGKTILMATMIFYEFLLANKYPKSDKYCHNVIVFAPDLTVLQSLKEIMTFDKSQVVPPEYASWLDANLKFHFMDESGMSLSVIDKSTFNIIISNTQKIILKQRRTLQSAAQMLFNDLVDKPSQSGDGLPSGAYDDLYEVSNDADLMTNQRFEKLSRLHQIGIYVDEAHHAFGSKLEKDLLDVKATTSLRLTINELTKALEKRGTHVVACYNYTGTPFVKKQLLPEVVYSYGLKHAIDNKYLKRAMVYGLDNARTAEFVSMVLKEFFKYHGNKRYEGMLPKIAFFATTIDSLETDLKPEVQKVLDELDITDDVILTNHEGASNEQIYQFRHLDDPNSNKQVILLVNKGKEGWNCRSLCAVALHRKPDSKIFVLQASMRCLRSLTENQLTAHIYLSEENKSTLEDELQDNFRLTISDIGGKDNKTQKYEVRIVPPPVLIKLRRVHKRFDLIPKATSEAVNFDFEHLNEEILAKYKITVTGTAIENLGKTAGKAVDVTKDVRHKIEYTELMLIAEISRYLNESPLSVETIMGKAVPAIGKVLDKVNEYNDLLYDWVIPRIFRALYEIVESQEIEDREIKLVNDPPKGFYEISNLPELTVSIEDDQAKQKQHKSFHLDHYCFDSRPENDLFWRLLQDVKVEKVYFTGMLTHGQTDFRISYIDPISQTVRYYYPDFLVRDVNGSYLIIEVKADNMIDSEVVKAKEEYTRLMAVESGMGYQIIPGTKALTKQLNFPSTITKGT